MRGTGGMVREGFINLSLLTGDSIKAGHSNATPVNIGKNLSEMMDLCPVSRGLLPFGFSRWASKPMPQPKFLKEIGYIPLGCSPVSKNFDHVWTPNWFIPCHLGGYGVDIAHAPTNLKITRKQRLLAALFVNDPKLSLYMTKGFSIQRSAVAIKNLGLRLRIEPNHERTEEEEKQVNEWLSRAAYITRASMMRTTPVPDKIIKRQIRRIRDYRIKPMSIETMKSYWHSKVVLGASPSCPPLPDLPNSSDGVSRRYGSCSNLDLFDRRIQNFPSYREANFE
jgi:hypothetical protein